MSNQPTRSLAASEPPAEGKNNEAMTFDEAYDAHRWARLDYPLTYMCKPPKLQLCKLQVPSA